MIYTFETEPFAHQREVFEATKDLESFAILWEQGCVDANTEYLSPEGWRRIASYSGGKVAQWDPGTGRACFVFPEEFVKLPCNKMLHFKTKYGVDQMLSPEHRMALHTKKNGNFFVDSAERVAADLRASGSAFRRLSSQFTMQLQGPGIGLSETDLRLMVAVLADGSFPANCQTTRTTLRLKKDRKKKRLRALLRNRDNVYERPCGPAGFHAFSFDAALRIKQFPADWWGLVDEKDKATILDEVFHWDGAGNNRYYSRHECDADFIQFLLCSNGEIVSKTFSNGVWCIRVRKHKGPFTVRKDNVSEAVSPDGYKYCFRVPSTFLVFRRNGCVFPSGNTGKSKLAIDTFAYLYEKGEIDAVLIVAPGGAHQNWIHNEIPAHLPKRVMQYATGHAYLSARATTGWHKKACAQVLHADGLAIMAMPYSGLVTEAGRLWAREYLKKRRVFYIVDEAHRIKEPKTKRSKLVVASGKLAKYKRVLTGTPIANGPFDVYAQLRFLDPDYWKRLGMGSYAAFKTQFGIWKKPYDTAQYEVLLAYRNLDELQGLIGGISSRVTKDDVLDLPPKLYSKRFVDLSPAQARLYKELKSECTATLDSGHVVEAVLPIVRLLRFRQLLCGYLPTEDGSDEPVQMLPGLNPRMGALLSICQDLPHKAIIWAVFTKDIDLICKALAEDEDLGGVVRYDGSTSDEDRLRAVQEFQDPESGVQFFVANPQAASESLTLHAARTVVYYSSSFKLTERLQSEDRAHRIGQEHPVNYIDIVARGTVDEHILKALVNKRDIANFITQDELKEWL